MLRVTVAPTRAIQKTAAMAIPFQESDFLLINRRIAPIIPTRSVVGTATVLCPQHEGISRLSGRRLA